MALTDSTTYGYFLALFTALLFGRVIGQIIVALYAPRWLPPMAQWQSGLISYRTLLVSQAVVLTFMVLITRDYLRGHGYFVSPHQAGGVFSIWFSAVYVAGMILRYVIRMRRHPDQRWTGGTIPIVFHCVVAAFLLTWGLHQIG